MHITIVIRGGVCQSVLCDDPEAEVQVLDFDEAKDVDPDDTPIGGTTLEGLEKELIILESSMTEVF